MEELKGKIIELLDKFTTEEMLNKAYEYLMFLLIHIQK